MRIIGSVNKLSKNIERELIKASDLTTKNDGLNLNLAISYGSKTEIVNAIIEISSKVGEKYFNSFLIEFIRIICSVPLHNISKKKRSKEH